MKFEEHKLLLIFIVFSLSLFIILFSMQIVEADDLTNITVAVSGLTDDAFDTTEPRYEDSNRIQFGVWQWLFSNWAVTDGIRFTGVNIPQGAIIVNATLIVKNQVNGDDLLLKISADDVDNSATFSNTADPTTGKPSARVKTTAQVDWDPTATWTADLWYGSVNISSVIQEIVDRSGWSSGNALSIIVANDGSANGMEREVYSRNSNAANAPNLTISYRLPSPFQWSNNVTSPTEPATYSTGQAYQFNVTWTHTANNTSVVLIEQNFTTITSTLENKTMSNKTTQYYFDVSDLPAGTYVWKSYANDTSNKQDSTPRWTYRVQKASPSLQLQLNGTAGDRSYTYPQAINATAFENNVADSDVTYTLFRDNVSKGTGSLVSENILLGNATYVYHYNNTAGTNWTSTTITRIAYVNKGSLNVTIDSPTNGTSFFRGDSVSLQSTIKNQNGTTVSDATIRWYNSTTNILSVEDGSWAIPAGHVLGNHNITANATHANYTTGSATANITIRNVLPQLTTPVYNITPAEILAGNGIQITCNITDYETAVGSLTVNISVRDPNSIWSNVTITDRIENMFLRNFNTTTNSVLGTYTSICDSIDADNGFNQSSTSTFLVYKNGTIEISMNATKVQWNDPVNISIIANRSDGSPIESGSTIIKVGSKQKCSGTTDSNGKYSCIFNAPNSIGSFTVRVEVTDPSTNKVIANTTTLSVFVAVGSSEAEQAEAGNVGCVDTPRLIQNPDGTIKTVFVRICVWR